MADNTEMSGIDNFSIQDTISMGAGSQELLQGLLAPDTSTGNPDDITPIIKEVIEPAAPAATAAPVTKNTKPADVTPSPDAPIDAGKNIRDFLGTNNSDDDNPDTNTSTDDVDEPDTISDDNAPVPETQFKALAKDLLTLGVFTTEEGEQEPEINTPDDFLARFTSEKQKGSIEIVNNFIGQFGEDYQNAFQAIFVNGANPREYFQALTAVEDFSTLDMKNEANQKLVLQHSLLDQGFEQSDIDAEIERLTNYGDLEVVAERNHKVLVKKQAANLEKIAATAQRDIQQKAAIRNEYVNNVQTVLSEKVKAKTFDGIPLSPKLANELHDFLLVDKYKTPSGETLTDFDKTILELKRPENHAMKVKIGLLLKILEKDPTLSTIQKTAVTSQANTLFAEVVRQGAQPQTQQTKKEAASRWFK